MERSVLWFLSASSTSAREEVAALHQGNEIALLSFGFPMSFVVWMICRWRFDSSTTSKSTRPRRPMPAAAR